MSGRAVRQVGVLAVAYVFGLSIFWWFATTVVPPEIESAFAGTASRTVARVVASYARHWDLKNTLEHWKVATPAFVIAGACHFLLVVMILVWHRRGSTRSVGGSGFEVASSALLIALSLAFLTYTVWIGSIQDYFFFVQIWVEIVRGHDPWFLVQGQTRMYPLNAYGPLFTVLAPLTSVNPLAPKILFASAFWLFTAWLVKGHAPGRGWPSWAGLVLLLWMANPYAWIEIATFGHLDVLVGLLCIAAVEARVRGRDYASAGWISAGALLKFFPGVLIPFLMLDGRRIRARFLAAALILCGLGMGAACWIWGLSALRPIVFAANREPAHLSIFSFLTGPYSPIPRDLVFFTVDEAATPIMLLTLAWLWNWTRREEFETFAASVLAVTVTLLLYKVGFTQYPMVLFVLGAYWFVRDGGTLRRRVPLVLSFCAYFLWVVRFDYLACKDQVGRNVTWQGLPTFILGCLLAASIVRSAPRFATVEPTGVEPAPVAG